jgi:uncharacterized coiled-coil DUF342 family protein
VEVVQNAIDALQKKAQAFTDQMQKQSTGKEEFFSEKAKIRSELDAVSAEMNKLAERKEAINAGLNNKKAEQSQMKGDLMKMKKSMGYTSENDIDDRIATIEFKLWTESLSLKDEKNYLAEIKELKKNKPMVSQVSQMEDKLAGFDSGVSLRDQSKLIGEEMGKLREKKREIQERLTGLTEKRKAQLGDLPDILAKREEITNQIKEKIQERQALRDDFQAEKKKFQEHLAEQRKLRQEKYQLEKKEQQEAWKLRQMERKVEELDNQPYVSEITLIEQTIKFCKGLLPQDASAGKKVEEKEIVHTNKDNETVLIKKEDREEFYFAPTKKGKAAKKAKAAAGGDDGKAKPIKHNAETFQLFDKLKLDAPITTADIPSLLEKLEKQMEEYQVKVKEWEQNKEELKRKIREGIVEIDLEEKKEEEAPAEEEKAAEGDTAEPEEKAAEEEAKEETEE